jgi:imidazolonepropionase-like amidohydrolase
MRAAVEEAEAWNTYVAAHAYTPRSIRRAVEAGIRSIEHGNLLDEPTAKVMAAHGAYLIPTNVTYRALHRDGKALGLPPVSIAKLKEVLTAGLEAVAIAKKCGVKIGHGSDLLGQQQCHQSEEFLIKGEVLTPYEVLTAATKTNAELLGRSHDLGILTPGALADLLIVDGNPLANLSVLAYPERHLRAILQDGRFIKNL